jgi:hypothetical protein
MGVKSDIKWPWYLERRFARWELAIRVATRGEPARAHAELLELLDRGLSVREGRSATPAELDFYVLLVECLGADPGIAELVPCARCRVVFKPRRPDGRMCPACNHGRNPAGLVWHARCQDCGRGFTAGRRGRSYCENCREPAERVRRSRGLPRGKPRRRFRFRGVDRLAGAETFTVTVNRGYGEAVTLEAKRGVVETEDAEAAKALRSMYGLEEVRG